MVAAVRRQQSTGHYCSTDQPVCKSLATTSTFNVTANNATSFQWFTNSSGRSQRHEFQLHSDQCSLIANNGMTFQVTCRPITTVRPTSSVATLTVTLPSAVTITVNCASNTGPVNPYVWGVGGPDKYIWYAGNTTVEQAIQNAGIKMVRIDPIQNCLYNGYDPYPASNTWDFTQLDAILGTIFASGANLSSQSATFPEGCRIPQIAPVTSPTRIGMPMPLS